MWVRTEKGKAMPVDAEPRPDGNLEISGGIAYVVKPDCLLPPPPEERYVSHFATCPNSKRRRKKVAKNEP